MNGERSVAVSPFSNIIFSLAQHPLYCRGIVVVRCRRRRSVIEIIIILKLLNKRWQRNRFNILLNLILLYVLTGPISYSLGFQRLYKNKWSVVRWNYKRIIVLYLFRNRGGPLVCILQRQNGHFLSQTIFSLMRKAAFIVIGWHHNVEEWAHVDL